VKTSTKFFIAYALSIWIVGALCAYVFGVVNLVLLSISYFLWEFSQKMKDLGNAQEKIEKLFE